MALLKSGETRSYDYAASTGTHWMHSHVPLQEMDLLAAPLIVRSSEDMIAASQEVVMFLHDFSFKFPTEVLEEITGGLAPHDMTGMSTPSPEPADALEGVDHSTMNMGGDTAMNGMDMSGTGDGGAMGGMDMGGMQMDLNDYNFDAYLANDRTFNDSDVVVWIAARVFGCVLSTPLPRPRSGSTQAVLRRG